MTTATQFIDQSQHPSPDAEDAPMAPGTSVEEQQAAKQVGSVCPRCGGTQLRKNGTKGGRQRFRCAACGKTWGPSLGHPSYRSKRSQSTWHEFMRGVETRVPLRELAERCGISTHTACKWRQKYLAKHLDLLMEVLSDMENQGKLKDGTDLNTARQLVEAEVNKVYRGRSRKVAERKFLRWQMKFVEKLERQQAR